MDNLEPFVAAGDEEPSVVTSSNSLAADLELKPPAHAIIYSSSSEGDDDGPDVRPDGVGPPALRSSSPPPKCAICLSRFKNKCFTDSCMHQFCFKCLCEWSKVKPECPLCKQVFKSIIHNVRSNDQYDRYEVQCNARSFSRMFGLNVLATRDFLLPLLSVHDMPTNTNRGVATYNGLGVHYLQLLLSGANMSSSYESYAAALLHYYNHEVSVRPLENSVAYLFRRFIYDHKAMAMPLPDPVSHRFRHCTASFYRANPAQTHRVITFAQRDLTVLLRYRTFGFYELIQVLHDALPVNDINSEVFKRRLMPFLGTYVAHFMHELYNFSRSTYDIEGYDRHVSYTSSSTDVRPPPTNDTMLRVSLSAGGDVERPAVSISSSSSSSGMQSAAINLSIRSDDFEYVQVGNLDENAEAAANAEVAAINTNNERRGAHVATANAYTYPPVTSAAATETIVLSSPESSSSDCEFVLERKPPHLRTPEYVSLNSASDSDVVFVDEKKQDPLPSNIEQANKNEATLLGPFDEHYDGPTTSAGRRSTAQPLFPALKAAAAIERRRCKRKRTRLSISLEVLTSEDGTDSEDIEYKPTTNRAASRKLRRVSRKGDRKEGKRQRPAYYTQSEDDEEEEITLSTLRQQLASNLPKQQLAKDSSGEEDNGGNDDDDSDNNDSDEMVLPAQVQADINSHDSIIVYEDDSGREDLPESSGLPQNEDTVSVCNQSVAASNATNSDTSDTDSDDSNKYAELAAQLLPDHQPVENLNGSNAGDSSNSAESSVSSSSSSSTSTSSSSSD